MNRSIRPFFLPLSLVAFLTLTGCAYRVGSVNTYGLHSIHVPVFKNKAFVARVEEQVSNAVIRQFQIDGSVRIATADTAEAVLEGEIIAWERRPLRFQRRDLIVTREFRLTVAAQITVRDRGGNIIVKRKRIEGETTYSTRSELGEDQVAAERQAFPAAADDLAKNIVEQVVEGW